ncbi:hypothetical protein LSCM1_05941 [Leishmania martiniquensis]|uniref:DNA/RNA non-specific endonuclease-like protein n=1 Tax=Leishmania martiniquensis TaxID=1580590 RepID=A0A836KRE8_9TRYP|nr:hypothetical protein LSCM1_05941 [Leishmania martiniquensis]
MEGIPVKNAEALLLTSSSSRGCAAPDASLPSATCLRPSWYTHAAQRLLHERAYYETAPLYAACGQSTAAPSLPTPAPSSPLKPWLACAIAAVSGIIAGAMVGAWLSPWLNRRATRLYYQREAKHRNPLMLLPSPAVAAGPQPWWWRRLWRASMSPPQSTHPPLKEARRLDCGHAAEWLVACTGYRWLPKRISQPTLLKLYSSVRHPQQRNTTRSTEKEIRWGTRMMNRGSHPLPKRSGVAEASKCSITSIFSALIPIARLTRAPLHCWRPLPQHAVDVFVPAACRCGESPRLTAPAAASPLLCLPRQGFTLLYDPVARLPVWCGFHLTRETVDRARRQRRCLTFFTDRSLDTAVRRVPAELKARGHDRGHLAPHASVAASAQAAIEAALLSNVQLQHHQINRGIWRWLEEAARAYVRQPPLTAVPHTDGRHELCVQDANAAAALCAAAAPSLEAASHTRVSPATPPSGTGAAQRRGRLRKSALPARCASARDDTRSRSGGSREALRREGAIMSRLLAASSMGSGVDSHMRLRGDRVRGLMKRTLRSCREWWRYCSGDAANRSCEFELAINVGPLYYRQVNELGRDNQQRCGVTTEPAPITAATTYLSGPCSSVSGRAHHRQRRRCAISAPTRSSAPPRPSLFIPDAFFFSVWNVHTHEHVHLIVPNHPNTRAMQAVTAALAARRPTTAGATTPKRLPSRRRRRTTQLLGAPSDDLEAALRSLAVPTEELEQLFAASLVELRSRCMSAGVVDATSRNTTSNINQVASPVALRTHFHLFPVYRQRWTWRCGGIGWWRMRSS